MVALMHQPAGKYITGALIGLAMLSDFVFHKICNIGSVMPCFFERLEINLQKSVFLFGS